MPITPLEQLIIRAEIRLEGGFVWSPWFRDCALVGNVLRVPSEEAAGAIKRMFWERLKATRPDLEMSVVAPAQRLPTSIKKAYRGKVDYPTQGDML